MSTTKKQAWLGLGGNLGDVEAAMKQGLQFIGDRSDTDISEVSSIYKTPPWGVLNQPWFLNCCAQIQTELNPEQLLSLCQEVERLGKRERLQKWGPRTIDVDILMYEGVQQVEQRLTIPHPRMQERAFVLVPLEEIAPNLVIDGASISDLRANLNDDGIENTGSGTNWWC